ncbi:TetR/AcrR family transcriptional regulator [Kineococcus sp. NPDC059986]|jgi:AcrR family transcriptional regulator|uniref:TetR/AcrR family transcriptional regulator n=1 Tax=Kineococcus sp. NPDC059986 TaxID=3155538 RepID=UPI00344EC7FF
MTGTAGDRVNPRRQAILQAASRQFAAVGYDRASTASICRAAGVSSGTFFHHFPTKLDVLVGVLDAGRDATARRLAALEESGSGLDAVLAHAADAAAEAGDPDYPGLVLAVATVEQDPRVAAALHADADLVQGFLLRQLQIAAQRGEVRPGATGPDVLARRVRWLLDGAAADALTTPPRPGEVVEAVRALLT